MKAARRIAHAINHIIALRAQRLRDQTARVGKIKDQNIWLRHPARELAIAGEDRDAAQRHGKPARARRLLTEHAVAQRRALIKNAAFIRIAPDGGNDIIRIPERFFRIRRQYKVQGRVAPLADQLCDLAIFMQLLSVVIHQHNLCNPRCLRAEGD